MCHSGTYFGVNRFVCVHMFKCHIKFISEKVNVVISSSYSIFCSLLWKHVRSKGSQNILRPETIKKIFTLEIHLIYKIHQNGQFITYLLVVVILLEKQLHLVYE